MVDVSDIWTEKYRPRKLREILGQTQAVQQVAAWANSWSKGRPAKRALLLYGPPGTGKSVAAEALARDYGWDFIEMNASDKRTMGEINRVAGAASTAGTLLGGAGGKRLIVLEEADNIHGTYDRGGYKALRELVAQTRNPVVLIANDQYSIPWEIRAACFTVNFRRLTKEAVVQRLQHVSKEEGMEAEPGALSLIAGESNGDMRAAIQDLQTAGFGRKRLTEQEAVPHLRDRERGVFDMIGGLLRIRTAKEAREFFREVDVPPDEALDWIAENVPRMVTDPAALAAVYDRISRAEIFLGRARRGQAYGLWSYASDLMSSGVAVSKGGDVRWEKFQRPSHIGRYSRTRGSRALRDSLALKLARHCHTSSRVVRRDFLPYFSLLKRERGLVERLRGELELGEGEVNYLLSL